MSKRHQSSRRRSYGRRQHELHEREGQRRHHQMTDEIDLDGFGPSSPADPLAFLDPRSPRLRFAIGE
ncbi:MAG TPA: hypothetical protein VFK35_07780 [Candidatus Limnocylindrales bacterium]|nr:hypothetical protein [Candidatus Limnocylindrales bacterium]